MTEKPPGSWEASSSVSEVTPTHLVVQCRDLSGHLMQNTLAPSPGVSYSNLNGVMWPDTWPLSLQAATEGIDIPRVIFQTHKSQQHVRDTPQLRAAQQSWQRWSGFSYEFFDDAAQDAFMAEHFPALYPLYAALPLPVMKADIWRYAVLYVRGGIYADVDTICRLSPDIWVNSSTLLSVIPEPGHNFMCQWVMAAPARSPLLGAVLGAIEGKLRAMGPVRPHHFRENPHIIHALTGPAVFTEALQAWCSDHHLLVLPHVTHYSRYSSRIMHVHPVRFHDSHVVHLYAGDHGWKQERVHFSRMP